ncbi:MAG: TetR/AcrR family transcriptional regulator [Smithellaceae bacterium]|nr:TetR/AcrR family transcriptional regulator [Smithellaceae bacterium]
MRETKKESILRTARQMFGHYGIRKTNLDEIARMSRVAKATIYNYFGSKERVFLAVLEREVDNIAAGLNRAVPRTDPPLNKLRMFLMMSFRSTGDASSILGSSTLLNSRLSPEGDRIDEELFCRQAGILKPILDEGNRNGDFEILDLELTTNSILYALRGFELARIVNTDKSRIEQEWEGFVNLIYKGIKGEKGKDIKKDTA